MFLRLGRTQRFLPVFLGAVTLAAVAALLASDAYPRLFPAGMRDILGAFSLAMIAVAYLIYQIAHRPAAMEFTKAILLAVAFLFWAANQFWPNLPQAGLFNDIAIALFVLDVFLVIAGWPRASKDSVFAESEERTTGRCDCGCCNCRYRTEDGVPEDLNQDPSRFSQSAA